MAVFNEPAQWGHALGNNADTSTLPDDAAATAGIASLQKLFQIINATPLEAGGIAPDREDVNALFKYLGDQIFYTQNGGVPSYNAAYDYIPGRVVLYTDNNIYKCIQANGASSTVVAPGTDDTYWQQLDREDDSTSLIPNQTIISELPLTDANLHLKDGALLSGSGAYSAYVDLIAELYNGGTASTSFCTEAEWQTSNTNYGFCNKFVYDSVANTVRLPKVNSEHGALIKSYSSGSDWYRIYQDGWCEQGGIYPNYIPNDTNVSITLLKPFINTNYSVLASPRKINTSTGPGFSSLDTYTESVNNFRIIQEADNSDAGAFWTAYGYTDISDLQTAPIYEYIVVGTVSKTDIQIDIDNVLADLANKADKNFSNVTAPVQAFKDMSIGWGMPDYSAGISLSYTSFDGSGWTAPSDGIITGGINWTDSSKYISINGNPVLHGNTEMTCIFMQVSKNDVVTTNGALESSPTTLHFYPLKGAN